MLLLVLCNGINGNLECYVVHELDEFDHLVMIILASGEVTLAYAT